MHPSQLPVVEICVDDAAGAWAAVAGGADRLEVCVDLSVGGLTPPDELIDAAVDAAPRLGVQVLVRESAHEFALRDGEAEQLAARIADMREQWRGARMGFVVGGLTGANELDHDAARLWREAAGDAPLTFHRAVDAVRDPVAAVSDLAALGYDRVLTTGGDTSVAQVAGLRRMVEAGGDSLTVLASGGLRSHKVGDVVQATGVREVHMRAPGADGVGTDQREVERIVAALRAAG